jgi:CRISPR-associated protein Cas1
MSAVTPFFRVRWLLRARSAWTLQPFPHAILYALLCEATRGESAPHLPEGLLLDAPEQCRDRVTAGESYAFGATLLEADTVRAARRLHQLADGLMRVGRLKPRRSVALGGNFDLVEMTDLVAHQTLAPGQAVTPLPLAAISAECARLSATSRLTLRFLSPLRLERPQAEAGAGHRFADGESLHPGQFLRTIQKRLAALGIRRAEVEELPFADDLVRLVENRLVWADVEYGARNQRKALGGALGRLVLEVTDPVARAALVWGQYTRLGRNLHFGFGRYRIEELGDDPTACARAVPLLAICLPDDALVQAASVSQADPAATLRAAESLRAGTYRPAPGQVAQIVTGDGDTRTLCIPARVDRALQRALLARLGPPLDRLFETSSFAWRKGLGREAAAGRIQRLYRDGWRFAVGADFDRFFDTIPRQLLRDRVEAFLGDDATSGAVLAFVDDATTPAGIPTGAPLSPLLGNLLLDRFDEAIEAAGGRLVRYADDFLVLTRTREAAERLHRVAVGLAEGLLLRLNEGAAVFDLGEPFRFLGFDFRAEERWQYAGPGGPRRVQELGWRDADRSERVPPVLLPGEQVEGTTQGVVVLGPGTTLVDVVGDDLRVMRGPEATQSFPLTGLERIIVFGPAGWSPDAPGKLLRAGVPVQFVSSAGWPQGELVGEGSDDPDALTAQCLAARDPVACLRIARVLVIAKIRNFATLHSCLNSGVDQTGPRLREMADAAGQAPTLDSLRGTEGAAAALWYRRLGAFLGPGYRFTQRVAPEASDPVNLLLNLAYTQLHRHLTAACRAVGLSPAVGFLHRGDGRYAALAADLQEPFRHLAERAVVVATRQIKPSHFTERTDGPHALELDHHASTRIHALLQRGLRLAVAGRGQSEPRAWLAQMLATARSLRRHLLDPTTPFEAFEHA